MGLWGTNMSWESRGTVCLNSTEPLPGWLPFTVEPTPDDGGHVKRLLVNTFFPAHRPMTP